MQHAVSLGTAVRPRRNGLGGGVGGAGNKVYMGDVQAVNNRFIERRYTV